MATPLADPSLPIRVRPQTDCEPQPVTLLRTAPAAAATRWSRPSDEPASAVLAPADLSAAFDDVAQSADGRAARLNRVSSTTNFNICGHPIQNPGRIMGNQAMDQARNAETFRVHTVQNELHTGDTLVFVNLPEANRGRDKLLDCYGQAFRDRQCRVDSQKLLATGSQKFADMLKPSHQYRLQRRLKVVNKLPEGVCYVLDLTPPSEGDDLVFQMTDMSLPPGIIKWWTAAQLQNADPWLVEGHDDVCFCLPFHCPPPDESRILETDADIAAEEIRRKEDKASIVDRALLKKARGDNAMTYVPPYRKIPDYCPVRHCNAVVRLLMFIQGREVMIDSAHRMWTLVSLAKIYDCAPILRDSVAQWILHGHNSRFIEVLPEEALQLGFTLQLPEVTQCAFRILVNEMALLEGASEATRAAHAARRTTLYGRKLGDLDDELKNLIQHAARALTERLSGHLRVMTDTHPFDHWFIPEWEALRRLDKLLEIEKPSDTTAAARGRLCDLMDALSFAAKSVFRAHVEARETRISSERRRSIDEDRLTYVDPLDFETLYLIETKLSPLQTLLLSFAYSDMQASLPSNLFYGAWSQHPKTRNTSFWELRERLEIELQKVVDKNTKLQSHPDWAEFLHEVPPGTRYIDFRVPKNVNVPILSLSNLELTTKRHLHKIFQIWLRHDIEPPLNITRHLLLTLNNNELKYLPLWAGGNNDGTGGVFESYLPPADMGPSGPGPSYHTGMSVPSASSVSGSLMSEIARIKVEGSASAASVDVHDSVSTVYRSDRVIALDDDDGDGMNSEGFVSDASEYASAKFAEPAEHQGIGAGVEQVVDAGMESDGSDETIRYEFEDEFDFDDEFDDATTGDRMDEDDEKPGFAADADAAAAAADADATAYAASITSESDTRSEDSMVLV